MRVLIASITAASGGLLGGTIGAAVGGFTGGPIGMGIGIAAGLIFGIMADNFAFNFDGKLDKEEFFNALKAIFPAILGGLATTIVQAIAEIGNRPQPDQQIRVYLDGRQLSDAVMRYQRRDNRANGG